VKLIAIGLTISVLLPIRSLPAQAIGAFRARASSAAEIARITDSLKVVLTRRLISYDLEVGRLDSTARGGDPTAGILSEGRALTREALAAEPGDPRTFLRRVAILSDFERQEWVNMTEPQRAAFGLVLRGDSTDRALVPPVLFKIPAVNFVLGTSAVAGREWPGPIEISTNLLGSAAGSAFEAIGAEPLKKYFESNLAVGTGFPTRGDGQLSGIVGVGFGQIRVGRVLLWPAVNLEQLDSADARLPNGLDALDPDAGSWTTPSISVAFAPWGLEHIQTRQANGLPTPIFTLGLALPYYYPGDTFTGLTALFSDRRGEYHRSGKARLVVGMYLPLQEVEALVP
jgi:hypothetical protein